MVIGAYAMAFHGFPRATGDIDLWIRCSDENAQKVWRALVTFGAPLSDLSIEDLKHKGTVFQIGVEPRRIDVTTQIDGVEFDDAWKHHQTVEIEKMSIPVIGKSDLLTNKKAANRPKDLGDIVWLESKES